MRHIKRRKSIRYLLDKTLSPEFASIPNPIFWFNRTILTFLSMFRALKINFSVIQKINFTYILNKVYNYIKIVKATGPDIFRILSNYVLGVDDLYINLLNFGTKRNVVGIVKVHVQLFIVRLICYCPFWA